MNRQEFIHKTDEKYSHLSNQVLQYYQNINLINKIHSYDDLQTAHEKNAIDYSEGIGFVLRIYGLGLHCREQTSLGQIGIAGVKNMFNDYLSKIINVIYEAGGDILHFSDSGDMVICTFSSYTSSQNIKNKQILDEEHMKIFYHDYQNALLCAIKLKDMDVITYHNESKRVYMQSFISFGTQQLLLVGGYLPNYAKGGNNSSSKGNICNHWIYSMNGSAYTHTHSNLFQHTTSVILVEKNCYELFHKMILENKIELTSQQSENDYLITNMTKSTTSTTTMIKSMEEEHHHHTLDIIENEFLQNYMKSNFFPSAQDHAYHYEFRNMFCIFMKLDLTPMIHNNEMDSIKVQELVLKIQEIISEYETTVRKVLILNNHLVSSAFWDIPNTYQSHAQVHSKRVLRNEKSLLSLGAAVKLRDMIEKQGIKCTIALSSGQVLTGVMGNNLRSQICLVGSTVERAAVLVRNNPVGGIYMDQNTFIRLPYYLLERVVKFPMNPNNPLTAEIGNIGIFNYNSRAIINTGESDFYEIRNITKDIVLDHFDSMKGITTSAIRHKSTNTEELSAYTSVLKSKNMKFILLEGAFGAGKKSTFDWLFTQAATMEITCYHHKVEYSDGFIQFTLIAKIFRMLVKDEMMDNAQRQTIVVSKILKDLYKDKPMYAKDVAYPAMKIAFRVTCEIDFKALFPVLTSSNNNKSNQQKGGSVYQSTDLKLNHSNILDIIKDILGYLLKIKPVLIAIMNIHFVDERSAKALLYLSNIECRSVIVLSAGSIDEKYNYPMFSKSAYLFNPNSSTMMNNKTQEVIVSRNYLIWFSTIRDLFVTNNSTTLIYLDDMSLKDLGNKLRNVLIESGTGNNIDIENNQVIEETANMIYKYAGKKLFWVQQCLGLIKQSMNFDTILSVIHKTMNEDTNEVIDKVSHRTDNCYPSTDQDMEDRLVAAASLFIESKASFSRSVIINTVMSDGIKYRYLINTRFKLLSRADQRVLLCASIIGFQFNSNDLIYIIPFITGEYSIRSDEIIDVATITASIITLIKFNWILQLTVGKSIYDFTHPIVYLHVNSILTDTNKILLHEKMVICMDKTYPKGTKEHYGVLTMHLSYFNTKQALEYTMKYVIHSVKPTNFQIHIVQVLELLYFSVYYCLNTTELTIVGKLVLLLRQTLMQYNEHPTAIDMSSLSSKHQQVSKQSKKKKKSGLFSIMTSCFTNKNTEQSTTEKNMISKEKSNKHKLNAILPHPVDQHSAVDDEVNSVHSFHSNNSSQNSTYSTISAIMGTKHDYNKDNNIYYFTNVSIEHITNILDELGTLISSLYSNYNNRGLTKQAETWHMELLNIINDLFQKYDEINQNRLFNQSQNDEINKLNSIRSVNKV